MIGIIVEKYDFFINLIFDGNVILEFLGKELIKGELDVFLFFNGGFRVIFEVRGYIVWDCILLVFIKDGFLCILIVFCFYNGEVLDKKILLLCLMEVINK